MAPLSKTDVVIIGMGAAGGVAAHVLTQAGLKVVGIEAGPRLSKSDYTKRLDELGEGFSFRNSLGGPKFNKEIPTWRPDATSPTQPPIVVGMANGVGGSSVHYGAQSWRFLEDDFSIRSATMKKYGEAALPKGAALADWPVNYSELEPYYDKVEYQIGVSGKGGSNPFEAKRSRDFPMPPLRSAGYPSLIAGAMTKLGHHPFPQPAAITSETYQGRPPCTFCGFCGYGFGCYNDSKSSTLVTTIAQAEKTGKLEIRVNSRVMSILSDATGRVTGVTYRDPQGKMQEQPARFVIVGGYIYENNRLLLLSKSKAYPHGLSNNHRQVGKYYTAQVSTSVNGLYPKPLNLWGGTSGQTVVMDDFNGDNFDHQGLGFIRGASIQAGTNGMPIAQSTSIPPGVPFWGSEYKRWLSQNATSVGGLTAQMETLPYEANFVDLDPTAKDELGVPVVRLTFNVYENEHKMGAFLADKMTKIHKAAGARQTWGGQLSVIPVFSHAYGGTRMGTNAFNSVVDKYSISHEAPNLAVMGASTYPNTTGYNPTETLQALAWYGADYIAKNFRKLTA